MGEDSLSHALPLPMLFSTLSMHIHDKVFILRIKMFMPIIYVFYRYKNSFITRIIKREIFYLPLKFWILEIYQPKF
jgi:hypothetical protein